MKKLLTLLCLLPLMCSAQKNEVFVMGGVAFNSNYINNSFFKGTLSPSGYQTFGYGRNFDILQVGIRWARHGMKSELAQTLYFESPTGLRPRDGYRKGDKESRTEVALTMFVNLTVLKNSRHKLYTGMNCGILGSNYKPCAGLQAGDVYKVNKWLGVKGEVGLNYYVIGTATEDKNFFVVPVSLGASFRF